MAENWPNFNEVDWDDLYPRLLLATEGRLRRIFWRGQRQAGPPHGLLASDFVQQAIEKALARDRSWDCTRTLFQNLWQIISSDISHVVDSYDNKHVISDDEKIISFQDYKENQEDTTHYKLIVQKLLQFLGERDKQARDIADLMINAVITSSKELSTQLRIPISEIENVKRRLRRHCLSYQATYGEPPLLAKGSDDASSVGDC